MLSGGECTGLQLDSHSMHVLVQEQSELPFDYCILKDLLSNFIFHLCSGHIKSYPALA